MFRYSRRQFNYSLLNMGVIRIGTLHDFRCTEHAQGVTDPKEGKKTVSHDIKKLHIVDTTDSNLAGNKDFRALEAFRAVKLGEHAKNVTFKDVRFVQEFDEPDCFILCTSKLRTRETMSQFEGADSCVEIIDVANFYSVITETLNSHCPVNFMGIHEVIYQNREEQWNGQDWGRHPALIKETRFKPQHELRAIWMPRFKRPLSPIILENYRLPEYCRSVSV